MKSYRYAELYWDHYGVHLVTTDSQMLDRMLAELKKVGYRVTGVAFPSGEKYYCRIERDNKNYAEVGWWILKQLCLRGWEPFAVNVVHYVDWRFYYHLRLEGSAQ